MAPDGTKGRRGRAKRTESSERRTSLAVPSWVVAFERISVGPGQMGGLPCVRGMRVTVSAVLGRLAAGRTIDEVLGDYPYLEREDVLAALEYAAAVVSERGRH
jgi:uncharacterized protein (DUF433 family)